jgi:uncharacterized protein (TIGR02001 family)
MGTKLTRIADPLRQSSGENVGQSRRRAGRCRTGSILMLMAVATAAATGAGAATVGGEVTAVTDYIFRGVSQNDGRPAAQLDIHVAAGNGLFAGIWATTLSGPRSTAPPPGAMTTGPVGDSEIQPYLGMRFVLSSNWNATLSAVDYTYFDHEYGRSDDYQELSVAFQYLDTLTFSLAASPNAVHYWRGFRVGRYAGYDASVSGEWPLAGPLLATAGAGYYHLSGPSGHTGTFTTPTGMVTVKTDWGTQGYGYGNVGLAMEHGPWRLDVGYYFSDKQAQNLFPYSAQSNRAAATLSWRF